MKDMYNTIFPLLKNQINFSTRINFDLDALSVIQIFNFNISKDSFDIIRKVKENPVNNCSVYISNLNIRQMDFKLDNSLLDEDVEISFNHSLKNISYPLLLNSLDDFYTFIKDCIIPLNIENISNIQNSINIKFSTGTPPKKINLKTDNLSVLTNDTQYLTVGAILLPNILPAEDYEHFSNDILLAFLNCISERTLDRGEYLIKFGNASPLFISKNISQTEQQITSIYSIIKNIFEDTYRYEDKLHILRKIITNYLSNNTNVEKIDWHSIYQSLLDHYSLFIDKKIDTFFELDLKFHEQTKKIFEDISKEISNKIDDLTKQLLTLLGTIISTFILKTTDPQKLIFLGFALFYCVVQLYLLIIKGVHFSSNTIKQNIEYVSESLKKLSSTSNISNTKLLKSIDTSLEKLKIIESSQKYFLILIFLGLLLIFIVA